MINNIRNSSRDLMENLRSLIRRDHRRSPLYDLFDKYIDKYYTYAKNVTSTNASLKRNFNGPEGEIGNKKKSRRLI